MEGPLPITSMNHISLLCRSAKESLDFYQNVLGFLPIHLIFMELGNYNIFSCFWLFNYGIGIHLLQSENPEKMSKKMNINPKDQHYLFPAEKKLQQKGIDFIQRIVVEDGVYIDQLFFHDPDGFLIEICTCENFPVIPLTGEPVQT
ncbi:hypothetical protein MKW98_018660 [Papaver atlanticum]|uniref:VOC domain-containing protein n=1 Tax=Papaver atlanticum TaxID=357466 RepID=A0AAD4T533_9MAGN|nr:hypothetical protein MKW98_018660 [Papaver atlanticum]